MDLRPMASELGLPVSRIWTCGEPRQTPKGELLEGVYRESYCALSVVTAEGGISAAIVAVETALRGAVGAYPILGRAELQKSLYCTLMDQGEVMACDVLQVLVDWGIQLELDGGSAH